MDKVKCDHCRHLNPHGTVLCESCGKPLLEEKTNEILSMRYEGSARRSQTYQRTAIDKIWNFFSSVKIGVTLIVLVIIASAMGTILPQEMYIPPNADPTQFYEKEYGYFGKLYYIVGFHNLYGSWWFVVLLALLGTSIIVASIDRVVPLHRALKNQRVTRHETFLKRQRVYGTTVIKNQDDEMTNAKQLLKNKRYNIREENGNVFAEKGRFSRWGPYVNHVGLIVVLIGAMLRFFPGMYVDETIWLREGETKVIKGTENEYYLKNHEFIVETYDKNSERFGEALNNPGTGAIPKTFQTDVTLYKQVGKAIPGEEEELEKVKSDKIRVNHPLQFEDFAVYQVDYKLNEFKEMNLKLEHKESKETFGSITVNLYDPKSVYKPKEGYKIELIAYFPDFYFNDAGEPATKSDIPNNPAFIFKMFTPKTPKGEISFVGIRKNIDIQGENQYKMTFAGIEMNDVTGLTVRKDRTLMIIAIGGFLFLLGVMQGMYWNHRRIWLHRKDYEIWLAATTNKSWFGLKKDLDFLTDGTNLNKPVDKLEEQQKS